MDLQPQWGQKGIWTVKNCFDFRYKVDVAQVFLELVTIFFPALAYMVLGKDMHQAWPDQDLLYMCPSFITQVTKIPLVLCVWSSCPQLLRTSATQTSR